MKTAISVPEQTFERAERRAHELGMSRSEFFTRAAIRYLDDLDAESVTRQINDTLQGLGEGGDDSWRDAVEAGRQIAGASEATEDVMVADEADESEW